MNHEDRVRAVAEFGFTPRQARFLVMVTRHAGVCLLRQYSTFAGIVHGQKTRAFFGKLVSRRYASAHPCRHNRGRVYHVHHYALYETIGEPNSPHRRPVPAGRLVERLMRLDGILADPDLTWLATAREKVAHFTTSPAAGPVESLLRLTRKAAAPAAGEPFPDKLPIGIDASSRAVFLYLVLPNGRDDFRAFLGRHAELLRSLPAWTLRLVFPRQLAHAYGAFQAVVRDEWESPLHARTIEELKWYFEQRRATPNGLRWPTDERFEGGWRTFDGPRFSRLYRHWLRGGDGALEDALSTLISEALATGAGRLECLVLPHRYDHLSPLVDVVGSASRDRSHRRSDEVPGGEAVREEAGACGPCYPPSHAACRSAL